MGNASVIIRRGTRVSRNNKKHFERKLKQNKKREENVVLIQYHYMNVILCSLLMI